MDPQVQQKVETFFSHYKKQHYKKGEILIRADEEPTGILYLSQGHVRKYAISKKGDEVVTTIFKPISFFPMGWAINNTTNTYFYEAVTDVTVYKAPKDEVLCFVSKEHEVLYDLLSRVYRGLDGLELRLTYLMAGSAYTRLVTELLLYTKRFGKENEHGFSLKLSEKELAALTGMTRETVSREIKLLKQKGLISLDGGQLFIPQIQKLAEEVQEGV